MLFHSRLTTLYGRGGVQVFPHLRAGYNPLAMPGPMRNATFMLLRDVDSHFTVLHSIQLDFTRHFLNS